VAGTTLSVCSSSRFVQAPDLFKSEAINLQIAVPVVSEAINLQIAVPVVSKAIELQTAVL